MRFDWQSYHDGSMQPQERAVTESALISDEVAATEYAAFKQFLSDVREAGMSEHVPQARLAQRMAELKGNTASAKVFRLWPVATAAAACVLAVLAFNLRPMNQPIDSDFHLDKSPQVATIRSHDPMEGAKWVSSRLGQAAPIIQLSSIGARFDGAECGYCWMAFEFEKDGHKYKIFGRKESGGLKGLTPFTAGSKTFYESRSGVGWYCVGEMTYWIVGGTREGRKQLAKIACQETTSLVQS